MVKRKGAILILAGVIAALAIGCGRKAKTEQEGPSSETQPGQERVTGLRFIYDMYSGDQFYLSVFVEHMSDDGAKATVEKRVGPMNYTGRKAEGSLTLSGEQAQTLREILERYDLKAWSELPSKSSGSAPSRSLIVFSGKDTLYDVAWNALFPKTLPPQEDIMYAELFNFFNDILAQTPGWEEVRSANLDDPRDNPAYAPRTVVWFGNEVKLVPGTGTAHADGSYAEIDYEGKDWWIEEGFVGRWTLDPDEPTAAPNPPERALLTVREDGTVLLVLDGEEWSGKLSGVRRYRDSAGMNLEMDGARRSCEVHLPLGESYERIHVVCWPGPVPEEQFDPIDVFLLRAED